jgi:hypothetical protein
MAKRIMQEGIALVSTTAAALGGPVTSNGERSAWDEAVAGKHAGQIHHEPRARAWLAATRTESTVGDLERCLDFVIRRC